MDFTKYRKTCLVCNTKFRSPNKNYCSTECRRIVKARGAKKAGKIYRTRKTNEDREKFTCAITTSTTWKEAIRKAGYKTDGYSRTRLQRFAKEENLILKPA